MPTSDVQLTVCISLLFLLAILIVVCNKFSCEQPHDWWSSMSYAWCYRPPSTPSLSTVNQNNVVSVKDRSEETTERRAEGDAYAGVSINFKFECKRCTILVDCIKLSNLKLAVVLENGLLPFYISFSILFWANKPWTLELQLWIGNHAHAAPHGRPMCVNCPKETVEWIGLLLLTISILYNANICGSEQG